jgi:hypothetical protein
LWGRLATCPTSSWNFRIHSEIPCDKQHKWLNNKQICKWIALYF